MTDFGSLQMIQTHFVLLLIGRRKEKHREQIRSLNSHRKYKNVHGDSEVNFLTKMEDGWLEKASANSKIENSKTKTLCVPKHHACLSMRTCDSKCFFCLEIASRCHYKPPTYLFFGMTASWTGMQTEKCKKWDAHILYPTFWNPQGGQWNSLAFISPLYRNTFGPVGGFFGDLRCIFA